MVNGGIARQWQQAVAAGMWRQAVVAGMWRQAVAACHQVWFYDKCRSPIHQYPNLLQATICTYCN